MTKAPAKAVSPLRAYLEQYDDLPSDALLGRIVLNTIAEHPIRRDDIVKWFEELDLDEALLPMENKAVDAFKKATSDTKDSYDLPAGKEAYLLCRDVTSNSDYIRRQITREVKDRALSYDEAIRVTFYRAKRADDQGSARLEVTPIFNRLSSAEHAYIKQAAADIYARYEDYLQYMDSAKTRAMVRTYLRKRLNAVEIKGGVYFVHSTHDDELSRLSELVNRLGGGCEMNQIPMPDSERTRAFVVRCFERETAQTLNDLTRDIREQEAKGKVSTAAYRRLKDRFDETMSNAEEYLLNLQLTQDSTTASAEVALEALNDLTEKMVSSDD